MTAPPPRPAAMQAAQSEPDSDQPGDGYCVDVACIDCLEREVGSTPPDDARDHEDDPQPRRQLKLTAASAIPPRRPRWLWHQRMAMGTLAILAGREGVGKSTLAYWIAAQVTLGTLPGELAGAPAAVLVAATEDSWAHTIVPRLIAAGADLDRVYRVEVTTALGGAELSLPADVQAVGRAAETHKAAMILLDPLMSRLSSSLDTHKDAETRQALEPLTRMLDRTHMVAIGLMHFNKSGSDDPMNALMASRAFSAVARSVSTVIRDPDDDTRARRFFGTPKNNLGRDDLPLLAFTLESHVVPTEDGDAWTARVTWGDEVADSITEVLRRTHADNGDRTATQEATDWLHDYMTEQGGSCDSATAKRAGHGAGHSEDSLKRARRRLGVTIESHGYPRRTVWNLPDDSRGTVGAQSGETHLTALTNPTEGKGAQSVQSVQSGQSGQTPRASTRLGCATCGQQMTFDDGTGRHPTCEAEENTR